MQNLMNIVFGAMLAGATLGPVAWTEVAHINAQLVQAASLAAGVMETGSPLNHAAAKARAALPGLPHSAH